MAEDARHSAFVWYHGNHANGRRKLYRRCASQAVRITLSIAARCAQRMPPLADPLGRLAHIKGEDVMSGKTLA